MILSFNFLQKKFLLAEMSVDFMEILAHKKLQVAGFMIIIALNLFYQTKEEIVCGSSTTAAAFAHWGSKIALSVWIILARQPKTKQKCWKEEMIHLPLNSAV